VIECNLEVIKTAVLWIIDSICMSGCSLLGGTIPPSPARRKSERSEIVSVFLKSGRDGDRPGPLNDNRDRPLCFACERRARAALTAACIKTDFSD